MGMAANRGVSLLLTIIVLALMIGGLTAVAYFLGVYLPAILSLVLVVLYRKQILDPGRGLLAPPVRDGDRLVARLKSDLPRL